ncbi:MAG: DEAD/DEAH box helicase family protein [Pirellulaceae bacterium]
MPDKLPLDAIIRQTNVDPRPYQTRIIEKTLDMFLGQYRNGAGEIERAARSVMIESPTGSGKSVMGLLVAKAMQTWTGAKIGWVAMRRNLLHQVHAENSRHGINADLRTISMFEKNPPSDIDLLIVDESHHDGASSMTHLHNVIQPKWILGLTATPFRTDSVRLCFEKVVKDAGIHQLIQDGYLSEFNHYTVPKWDVGQLADHYCAEPARWGKSIFFFHMTAECFALQNLLKSRGIASHVVTGSSDRDRQLAAFRGGQVQVLINCMVLTEGFDDPSLQTVWVRPSAKGPTIQMAGRALRQCEDIPAKQIVQCRQTPHPFPKTAMCRQQYLWQSGEWRSLKVNPKLNLCNGNVRRAIARTQVVLPKYLNRDTRRRLRPTNRG